MSSGKGHINGKRRCGICGLTGGLKTLCNGEGCRGVGEKKLAFSLHPSCARQAGYEVGEDEEIGFKGEPSCCDSSVVKLPSVVYKPLIDFHLRSTLLLPQRE
jgi:hypothetical protein